MIKKGIENFNKHLRFCTPGHKGRLLKTDVTELEGVFPADLIEKSQQKAANFFQAAAVRYLVGGSSLGIKAALMTSSGSIIAASNSHQSIAQSAKLAGKPLILLQNQQKNGLELPLSPAQIESALKNNPHVSTVVLAHPDYYGLNSLIESAEAVKNAGKMLYVDGAHGAHYFFRPDLFDCRIFALADAFNLSAHKTLNSLTQTAYLCINNAQLIEKIDENLSLLSTTSPFYPFFSSLENAINFGISHAKKYDRLKAWTQRLKITCAQNDDFTRLVVPAKNGGKNLFDQLKKNHIAAEKFDENHVVFILTLADCRRSISKLCRILEELC